MDGVEGLTRPGFRYDLLVVLGAHTYTLDADDRILPGGSVFVANGRIVAVVDDIGRAREELDRLRDTGRSDALGVDLGGAPGTVRIIDGTERMLLPGFVNNHFHDTSLMRAPAANPRSEVDADLDPPSLFAHGGNIEVLSSQFGPIGMMARSFDDRWCLVSGLMALAWQLRGGATTWADLGSANKPDVLAEASLALGMRGIVSIWGADVGCGFEEIIWLRLGRRAIVAIGIGLLCDPIAPRHRGGVRFLT